MKHFTKELNDLLAGPPRLLQRDLANRAGLTESSLSRILSDRMSCDGKTLDLILSGFTDRQAKRRLVAAYLKDQASPAALALLHGKTAEEQWAGVEFNRLSRKGETALRGLLKGEHLQEFEKITITLASAFGYDQG